MKAIQTHQSSDDFGRSAQYVLKIEGKWFKLTQDISDVLDGTHACSDNVYKWDLLGHSHNFKIEECEEPEKVVPPEVEEFLSRFINSGKETATLMKPLKDNHYRLEDYPVREWGWSNPPLPEQPTWDGSRW